VPAHSVDSASAPDAPETDKPANLATPVDPAQPQAARAETSPSPAAVQPQSAAIDIAAPNAAAPHGFEVQPAHAGTPRESDNPVKLAFSAPNVPDRSAFDALALKIASHSSGGESRFSIRLDPAELGKIEVNLNVDAHGHAQAELSADKPQTLELLQKDASALERALKDAGLNLSGGLAFSLKDEGRSQAWRDSQGGRGRSLQIAAADAASANATLSARAALAAQAYGLPTSHLDIRV
jgi:chemotaxis protein MotD